VALSPRQPGPAFLLRRLVPVVLLALGVALSGCLGAGPSIPPGGAPPTNETMAPEPGNVSDGSPSGGAPNSSGGWVDIETYTQQRFVPGTGNISVGLSVIGRAVSPDDADLNALNDRVAVSYPDGTIEVWWLNGTLSARFSNTVMTCGDRAGLVRFLGNDALLTTCDTTVIAFGLDGSFRWSRDLRHQSAFIESLDVSADGNIIAVRFAQPEVRVWDRASNNSAFIPVDDAFQRLIDLSEDGRTLAVTGQSAKFYSVDASAGTYARLAEVHSKGEAALCAGGATGFVGRLDDWGSETGLVNRVDLQSGNVTQINLTGRFADGGLHRGSPYQTSKVFASPDCAQLGLLDTDRIIWADPNATARFGYLSVELDINLSAPDPSAGFGSGPPSFPAEPEITPTTGTGSIWTTRLFLLDDGSAVSISSNRANAGGGGDVLVWLTRADPGATLPTIDTQSVVVAG
jgi:hypothetical protein